jgi:hypothetical protein
LKMKNNKAETGNVNQQQIEEIKLFIQYGVKDQDRKAAEDILTLYSDNPMVLNVLRDYYSRVPELREEAVCQITKIVTRQGMYLLGVTTQNYEYLYFFNGEKSLYIGETKEGIDDSEILVFFGYSSNEDFLKDQTAFANLPVSSSVDKESKAFCPACSVAEGEIHHLGCPVEICPWCEGQISYCSCRFDKLGVEEIVTEEELELFEIILNEKGRLPFTREQGPSYPEGGQDLPE